jgi:MOSC domain-containing protein YiiM
MILEAGAGVISTNLREVRVTEAGFEGDRHAGEMRKAGGRDSNVPAGTLVPNTRQVSIVSKEELAEISRRLDVPRVEPRWLGANLSLQGIPKLTGLPRGTRLVFEGGVAIVVDSENRPCTGPGEAIAAAFPGREDLAARFPKSAIHLRGLVGWVESPGELKVNEKVEVVLPPEESEKMG